MRAIREGLVRLSEDIHAFSYRLHPVGAGRPGFGRRVEGGMRAILATEAIPAAVQSERPAGDDAAGDGLLSFRVAQEALRNVARHAGASSVDVSVGRIDGGLQLAVRDNGVGFASTGHRHQPSLGLASMKERVRLLGGRT